MSKPGKNGPDAFCEAAPGADPEPPTVGIPKLEESCEDGMRRDVESEPPMTAMELVPAPDCFGSAFLGF